MNITINGETHKFNGSISVSDILLSFSVESASIAVELNREIVPPSNFTSTTVKDGDIIEIINFIGGG